MIPNYISEDYCSEEIRSLLEGNGYVGATQTYLDKDGFRVKEITLQSAMKWLREVHSLYLDIVTSFSQDGICYTFSCSNTMDLIQGTKGTSYHEYQTYEEACEAAIKFCLKNLIKNEDEESDIPVPKTVDEAISTLEKILSDEDREYLLENGAISMHNSLGRWIRNEWGLWTGSELKDELMSMNKGLNHPDDMSNYIIEEFIKYWNNKV